MLPTSATGLVGKRDVTPFSCHGLALLDVKLHRVNLLIITLNWSSRLEILICLLRYRI